MPRISLARIADPALWAWLLAVAGWIALLRFTAEAHWDTLIFLSIGRWLPQGILPYRDAIEMKPPGIFLYLGALFGVAGPAMWVVRFGELLWSAVAIWAVIRLLAREAGRVATAVAGTALLVWHWDYSFNVGGIYTEQYSAIAGLAALACRRPLASGAWVAVAVLFKHPGVAVVVAIVAYRWSAWTWRDWAYFAAAAAVPVAVVAAGFALAGGLDGFLYANFHGVLEYGRTSPIRPEMLPATFLYECWRHVRRHPLLVAAIGIGLVAMLRTLAPLAVAAAAWLAVSLLAVYLQARFFEHHFTMAMPPIALLAGVGLGWVLAMRVGEGWWVRALRAAAAGLVLWWGWAHVARARALQEPMVRLRWQQLRAGPSAWPRDPRTPFEAEIAAYLREHSTPADRVHVQAWTDSSLGTYWYAERPPAVPLFYELPYTLDRKKQVEQLLVARPLYVVLGPGRQTEAFLTWLRRDYILERTMTGPYTAEIWRRRDPGTPDQTSRSPLAIGARTARTAGKTPPRNPIASA